VNDDRPISHSFEDLAVTTDGTVLVAWIDSRQGASQTATWVARVTERGSRLERVTQLPAGETCVCCRVSVSAGPGEAASVLWRKVFPGDVRDMVLSRSTDGGRTFAAAALVHADRWKITACPHRGGSLCDGKQTGLVLSSEPGDYQYTRKGEIIRCPWHSWEFDIRTGKSWCDPEKVKARRFGVSVEKGAKLIEGPYVAETFRVSVENDYVVVEA